MGYVHLYCGDGKGKTTSAIGLSIRAASAGKKVLFTQFMKSDSSSEIKLLSKIEGIKIMHSEGEVKFVIEMNDEEKNTFYKTQQELFLNILKKLEEETFDLVVLDEITYVIDWNIIGDTLLNKLWELKNNKIDIIMTGRTQNENIINNSDYVTEMKKIKHPFDQGIAARKGIEF